MEELPSAEEAFEALALEQVELFVGSFEVSDEFAEEIRNQWTGNSWQFDPYFDEKEIDDARCTEMVRLERYDSYKKISTDDYNGEIIEARWVDQERQVGLRSRICCKDFRTGPSNERLFAGTPDAVLLKKFLHFQCFDRSRLHPKMNDDSCSLGCCSLKICQY